MAPSPQKCCKIPKSAFLNPSVAAAELQSCRKNPSVERAKRSVAISFAQGARGGLTVSTSLLDTSQGLRNVRLRFPQNHGIPGAGDFKCDLAAPDCDLVGLWCTTSKSFSLLPIPQEQLGLLPVGYIPPQLYRVLLGCTGLYWAGRVAVAAHSAKWWRCNSP